MERDQFAWMLKFCKPTAAQEAELSNCPFAREFENFEDSSPFSPSQSPPRTPMTPLRMVSLPPTPSSVDQCMAGEGAVFHTPPEHHAGSHLEDRNPNDLCAEKVTISEAKRGRVVAGEEFDGDTVPLGETEVVETEGDGGVGRTRVLSDEDLVIASSLDECYVANQAEAAARGTGREVGGLMNNGATKLDAINMGGTGGEKPNETSDSSGSSESCEIIGYKSCETESGGFEKCVESAKSAEKTAKDGHGNGGVRSNCKRTEKIDAGKQKLSPSCKGKQKDAGGTCEIVECKSPETESGGLEKGVEMAKSAERSGEDGRNGGVKSNGSRIDGRKQKLSPSCKGKEKVASGGSCEGVGYKSCETESGRLEKGIESAKSVEKIAKDGHGNGGVSSNDKRTEKIDAGKQKLSPSCKGKEKVAGGSCETESGGLEKGVEMAKSADKSAKDGHGNEDVRSNDKRIEKADGRKRKLPPWCPGKEKDTGECSEKQSGSPPLVKEKGKDEGGSSKKKNGLSEFSEFLDFLMKHFTYKCDDDEDEDDDFIATAKRRGVNFVEPRIWKHRRR